MNTLYNNNVDGALKFITINGQKYQIGKDASSSEAGIAKLYNELGTNTDGAITQAAVNTAIGNINSTIGTVTEGKTVVEMIGDAASAASSANSAMDTRMDAAEAAINTLNGDSATAGSVDKKVADAVAGIIDGAPQTMDTLKEVSDWIENDQTGAAAMIADIAALQSGKKDKQSAYTAAGMATDKTIATLTQNANGEIAATFQAIQDAGSAQHGLMSAAHYNKLEAISATVANEELSIVTQAAAA